jgi:NADP-dependent 3-hydroxy acid dehydrogenase YdfG
VNVSGSLRDLAAIITGAGSGIGEATAEDLAAAGVRVAVVGRRADRLNALVERIHASGGDAVSEPGDIRDFAQMEAIVARAIERWGKADIFVANAAVVEQSHFSDGDPESWRKVIDTNVMGTFNSIRAVLPQMHRQGSGHVVIVSSLSGRISYVGEPAYVASKHALVAMGHCLRKELAPQGIRVTLIEPGLVQTEFFDPEFAFSLFPDVTPLAPADVARTIRFVLEQPPNVAISEVGLHPVHQVW